MPIVWNHIEARDAGLIEWTESERCLHCGAPLASYPLVFWIGNDSQQTQIGLHNACLSSWLTLLRRDHARLLTGQRG